MATPKRVLIVDDEPLLRWVLRELLRGWGYEPSEAGSTAAALAAFAATQPAAVLLDINLPDGSGLDLLRELKRLRPQTAVIMMTAEVLVEHAIAALRGEAADFIAKPINNAELRAALDKALASEAAPQPKARLLIIADSTRELSRLKAAFGAAQVEINGVATAEDLPAALKRAHDVAIIDVEPARLENTLNALRANELHARIPAFVVNGRVIGQRELAGVLPKYRAMPCTQREMLALTRRLGLPENGARHVL
jgi:DNA-binding NtrC family response regulator